MSKPMRVTPEKRNRNTGYPTHEQVDNRPDLLQHIPARWQTNPAVLTALASVTMLSATNLAIEGGEKAKAKPVRVAPVFQHGEGRGAFGCEVINPPVFLSEDEARQVINDEAKHLGLSFKSPKSDPEAYGPNKTIDGKDVKRALAYVYVSEGEGTVPSPGYIVSSVRDIDTLKRAKTLVKEMKPARSLKAVGVFYDPMPSEPVTDQWNAMSGWDTSERAATAKQQLRLQVRDFVKWLKAQGVI